MENYRSQSTREGRNGYGVGDWSASASSSSAGQAPYPTSMQDLRSYSTSYASSYVQPPSQQQQQPAQMDFNTKMKKAGKSRVASSKSWGFSDPELQRKKRVVSYKAYAMEGKVKGSIRKSFRWIKDVVHGLW
ncbi:OLC1v1015072C1 [Oldenlandia corymbosa var. corymbosa]|uniref:OLC1v1015072C1 n=1 Tax=Oldenlandia corymbosa var. corymbosa TaxID=529605 RepID=A0AAV1E354_OLDCO|nr:OLC1v1015072C1 [Oldenlandia corymbosa var. corymbosa]